MFSLSASGSFQHAFDFLKRMQHKDAFDRILEKYAQEGVRLLSDNTPFDTGNTASSWGYEIERNGDSSIIHWTNSHVNKNVNIAVILQYGHGTGTGGYVQGRDYINPATQQAFDQMVSEMWREVTRV